jgi:hypothetical protein
MSENILTGFRIWHLDIRYHFVREFIEDGFIKIKLARSAKNDYNLFTISLSQELYERKTKKFLKTAEITVLVDCYRIGRVLMISFTINHLVLHV